MFVFALAFSSLPKLHVKKMIRVLLLFPQFSKFQIFKVKGNAKNICLVKKYTISPGKLPNPANTITGRDNEVKDINKA